MFAFSGLKRPDDGPYDRWCKNGRVNPQRRLEEIYNNVSNRPDVVTFGYHAGG
ncbi:hypothetical protein ES703_66107 [subsurface metagenome]